MQEVTLRDFLRSYKKLIPFPEGGIKIVCRDDRDFYITYKKPSTTDDLRKIAQFLAQEMRGEAPAGQQWEEVESKQSTGQRPVPIGSRCEAKLLMPWETACNNRAEPFLVANTKDGLPMGPSDWKTVHLCELHKQVIESMGGYEVETA